MLAGIVTAILLLVFVIGSLWVYSPKRNKEFHQASLLPFEDTDWVKIEREKKQ